MLLSIIPKEAKGIMLPVFTPPLKLTTLHDASVSIARCRTLHEVVSIMESVLAGVAGGDAFDIVWMDDEPHSLRTPPHTFARPDDAQRLHLADGAFVMLPDVCFIPFVVQGHLCGWLTLNSHIQFDQSLLIWTAQCAMTLASLVPQTRPELDRRVQPQALEQPRATRQSEQGATAPVAPDLRSSFSMQELADQIISAVQHITGSPRILLAQIDAEYRTVVAVSTFGLPPVVRQRRDIGIDYGDWLRMLKRSLPLGLLTFHVGQHPQLGSFRSAVVVQIPGSHETPEGVIVIDVGERSLPLAQNIVDNMETVARQASTALSNVRLYSEQQQTVDRLTALNAFSLAMSTAQLSVKDMLSMALAGAVGTTGGEGGGAIVTWKSRPSETFGSPFGTHVDPAWIERFVPLERDYIEFEAGTLPQTLIDGGAKYLLIAPLRGTNLTMGALWIEYSLPSIDQSQREMIVLYAKMAGSVLENMHLDELVVNTRDRLASILSSAHEGMVLIDEHGRVGVTNRAFGQLLDVDEAQWEGRHMEEFCRDEEILSISHALRLEICDGVRDVLQGREESATGDVMLDTRSLSWQVLPVRGATSASVGALLVIHDVTAERRMESLRQDLSNMIVHDLRSPLTNIMVSVDLLLKQSTGTLTDSQQRILQIASTSCQQMLDLVNALLDIRRLQQQTIELHRRPIEIVELANNVLERLEQLAQDKRIQTDNQLASLPRVMADPDMMRRVLQNLVDNALKFSRPGEPVRLTGTSGSEASLPQGHAPGRWVIIAVQDCGVGIPEEYHHIIFELFTQAPGGYGRGTGVGLAFCKLAVEAHGGQIWVESVPGEGTTFYFSLPVA